MYNKIRKYLCKSTTFQVHYCLNVETSKLEVVQFGQRYDFPVTLPNLKSLPIIFNIHVHQSHCQRLMDFTRDSSLERIFFHFNVLIFSFTSQSIKYIFITVINIRLTVDLTCLFYVQTSNMNTRHLVLCNIGQQFIIPEQICQQISGNIGSLTLNSVHIFRCVNQLALIVTLRLSNIS